MAYFCDTPSDISDIASKDVNRIVGVIAKALAANSPYMNVINGGVFPSGTSDAIRSIVQMQARLAASAVRGLRPYRSFSFKW